MSLIQNETNYFYQMEDSTKCCYFYDVNYFIKNVLDDEYKCGQNFFQVC